MRALFLAATAVKPDFPPWLRRGLLGLLILLTGGAQLGCTQFDYETLLAQGEITSDIMASEHFQHRLFYSTSFTAANKQPVHIYLGGDGNPWRNERQIASDPTPPRSPMLQAMLHQPSEAVYIGRPCYYHVQDSACEHAEWWTLWRYHPRIVDSLVQVIDQHIPADREIWLMGYSGGGTLAVLVARRLNRPVYVITFGANLDHHAWTAHHHYTPLTDSLNPITDSAHNPAAREIHWYGHDDSRILPAWTRHYCQRHNHAQCHPIAATHDQGWQQQWPALVAESQRLLQSTTPSPLLQ